MTSPIYNEFVYIISEPTFRRDIKKHLTNPSVVIVTGNYFTSEAWFGSHDKPVVQTELVIGRKKLLVRSQNKQKNKQTNIFGCNHTKKH